MAVVSLSGDTTRPYIAAGIFESFNHSFKFYLLWGKNGKRQESMYARPRLPALECRSIFILLVEKFKNFLFILSRRIKDFSTASTYVDMESRIFPALRIYVFKGKGRDEGFPARYPFERTKDVYLVNLKIHFRVVCASEVSRRESRLRVESMHREYIEECTWR